MTYIRENDRPLRCDPLSHLHIAQVIAGVEIIGGQRREVVHFDCFDCSSHWTETRWVA